MTHSQRLYTLLKEEVIADVEDHMDYLYDLIAKKKATQEDEDDLKEAQSILKEFKETLDEITSGEMGEEECLELIEELEKMRSFEED